MGYSSLPWMNIRHRALERLAALAIESPAVDEESDIVRLTQQCRPHFGYHKSNLQNGIPESGSLAPKAPMDIRELDILLALCKAAPSVDSPEHATQLFSQLSQYLPVAHAQSFQPSPFLQDIKPSPWESLTYHLTLSLLSLGLYYPSLHDAALSAFDQYLLNCAEAVMGLGPFTDYNSTSSNHEDVYGFTGILSATISLVGFLDAASVCINFWTTAEKLRMTVRMREMLSESFMISIETASSAISHSSTTVNDLKAWKRYNRQYAATGRPLGTMLVRKSFMRFLKSCAASLIGLPDMEDDESLNNYTNGIGFAKHPSNTEISLTQRLAQIITEELHLLADGSDYLQVGLLWQQQLAYSAKAFAFVGLLSCTILSEDVSSADAFILQLDSTLMDVAQMSCLELATSTLKSIVITSRIFASIAPSASRSLLRFIVQGSASPGPAIALASTCLSQVLGILPLNAVLTTLYSLGNVLSAGSSTEHLYQLAGDGGSLSSATAYPRSKNESITSLMPHVEDDGTTYRNVIHAIVTVASSRNDDKVSALAQSMLLQKIGKLNAEVDAYVIQETALLALSNGQAELQLLLRFYSRIYRDEVSKGSTSASDAVQDALIYLSASLKRESPLYRPYLIYLMECILNDGDAADLKHSRRHDMALRADEFGPFLKPLALLVAKNIPASDSASVDHDEVVSSMFRDTWFNLAVHGFLLNSESVKRHITELRLLAKHSPSLVTEDRTEMLESDLELNTVLRRGMGAHNLTEQRKILITELPSRETEIKRLSYPKAVFLNAALLVETLRASSGHCTGFLSYFLDPALATADMASCMDAISEQATSCYLSKTMSGRYNDFSAPFLARQLADLFVACCHRIERVQNVAVLCANKIINECPSSLCEEHSLFVLLEVLTIMWSSCLDAELDEFGWKSSFTSPRGLVKVNLPDSYIFRRRTFDMLIERARAWVTAVMNIAPLDVKGILQTYLSESETDYTYDHVSMGRSFALEMGSLIPQSDQRLSSIDSTHKIDVASDFIAQYTARQKYRQPSRFRTAALRSNLQRNAVTTGGQCMSKLESIGDAKAILRDLYQQADNAGAVSNAEIKDALERAATILCNSNNSHPLIAHYLVALPFRAFSKQSIRLGASVWLGVMHENPKIKSRILVEVLESWERTVDQRRGLFSPAFGHLDPFYAKIELLPSDKALMLKEQQRAQDIIAPHFEVLRFLESHFCAIRRGSAQDQRLFSRFVDTSTKGLLMTNGHPLAREIHFRIVLFCLKILKHSASNSSFGLWKTKDQILSAALSWFKHPPRWSLGCNKLQIKAERKILSDVASALAAISGVAAQARGPYRSLQAKQNLLQAFIEDERLRLDVWLSPLVPDRKYDGGKSVFDDASSLLQLAWVEGPGLAIQFASRFPSATLESDIQGLLLGFPEKCLDEPVSLEIMFKSATPADISGQLKYLLYWAPVNPTEALTYFLPAYGNHPSILQYAMRTLESHPIEVRFYLVPQLVQALRYDAMGYVERYILETAKISQLFAHQIIWNMKANSYKDEDSQIPDPLKPRLDKFMERLISSFSDEEREFYEREFSFFNDITGISGKLRPYIKKSKSEKKEKIEEELRKIRLEVGVYLPSNPDGTVVGIDRKSGKPLQSHAKAPYMATFRLQKQREQRTGDEMASVAGDRQSADSAATGVLDREQQTYEVWQSAIFKVGDDCRQDMLALQMIAAFRSIFTSVGLDVWLFPYRVTSTAPGCGVIDVLPNSISRDMLGREAVNGLYDYFVSKFGGEDSIRFQEARTNFVKSMAAYSVVAYLLQFKDRHNGNIMIDDTGHIIHIDFGFCFDIAPGGVRFERAPFKLTSEMIAVMSGPHHSHSHIPGSPSGSGAGIILSGSSSHGPTSIQPYQWFESLTVKAFLASRPYCSSLSHIVSLMLDSGLPCFKPDTLKNFRDRFALEKTEREAAEFMREMIKKSYMNVSTKGYDQFQLLTNGIPY